MLKALVILVAIFIAVVNVSAQSNSVRKRVVRKPGVVRLGPSTTYLKQGLSIEEVVRLLGEPNAISALPESNGVITYEFQRSAGRVLLAEFDNGLLVNSHIVMRASDPVGR